MPSPFHLRNERIRKAIARRAKEKALDLYDMDVDVAMRDIMPDEPGDGRIVRKAIDDEENESWD